VRILLIAEDAPGIQLLRALQERDHEIVAVLATRMDQSTRGATMWGVAEQAGIRTWPAERATDPALGEVVREEAVDLLVNAYSLFIVHRLVLDAPRIGAYNLHPGPLPAYAGLNSVCWAIYHGEGTHGVTVHRMEPTVDTGPIAYQATFPVEPTDNGLTVSTRCIRVGVDLMIRLVDTADHDPTQIPAVEQDLSKRSYFGREIPNNGRLSWATPAKEVRDFVRACDFSPLRSPWGTPTAELAGREVGVAGMSMTGSPAADPPGSVRPTSDGSVLVACIDEWVRVDTVILHGRRLTAAESLSAVGGTDGDTGDR
jgi:methionyl-tRNA formyltransferase